MKNKFIKIALSFLFALTSLTMFACGGEPESKLSYKDFSKFYLEMEQNTEIFKTDFIDGVSSKFIIKELDNTENKYYNECLTTPIKYITKYYTSLELVEKKQGLNGEQAKAINDFETSSAQMKLAYLDMKLEHARLVTFASQDQTIYNGALQQFKFSVTEFIEKTYDTAINLSIIQDKVLLRFNDLLDKKLETQETEELRDYTALKIGKDFYNILLKNTNSKTFATSSDANIQKYNTFLTQTKSKQTSFLSYYFGATNFKNLTSIKEGEGTETPVYLNKAVQEVFDAENVLENERNMLDKALDMFSFYDFFISYNCNITAYEKDLQFAEKYLNKITDYYETFIQQHINYLKSLLIN